MIEIRFHGRGGQGAVTSVELLALAAIEEGKYAQGFPSFGPERRGAPVLAFSRVDDKPIKLRCKIVKPDVVVVPIVNTTMIGALLRATGVVQVETMEAPLKDRFGPLAVKNFNALKVAYEQTTIEERRS